MTIKIVVLGSERLPTGVEFPPLQLKKYGWEQYPRLTGDDIAERCWRADIVVTLGTEVDRSSLEKMLRIGLLIGAGEVCSQLDQAALTDRGVEVLVFPDAELDSPAGAQDLCNRVSAAIDHYLHTAGQ